MMVSRPHRFMLLLVSLADVLYWSDFVLGQEVPPDNTFLRRGLHSVAVLGNYLYIEGGEISQYVNGDFDRPWPSRSVNKTLSLPLDTSWTNTTVTLKEIDKASQPPLKLHSLWTNPTNDAMLSWGGESTLFEVSQDARNPRLRIFTPDGQGGGTWSYQSLPSPREIKRSTGASAASCNGVGFHLGGWGSPATDTSFDPKTVTQPLPGLVTYDMGRRTWANESSLAFSSPFGTHIFGSAVCLPSLGSIPSSTSATGGKGLVFFIAGDVANLVSTSTTQPVSLQNLTFYDVAANRWHSQTTTGDVPSVRRRTCAVVAQSAAAAANSTSYEIFVYGGASGLGTNVDQGLGDMYVLTVPGFRWFRIDAAGAPRQGHACAVGGKGKRQMISVGGFLNTYSEESWKTPDPWPKGLGVFDMTRLVWTDKYDPDATAYEAPDKVKEWYRSGALANVVWDKDETKALFASITTPVSSGTTPSPTDSGSSSSDSSSSTTNIGAIIGGAVGGVAALAIGAAIFVYFWLRRRRARNQETAEGGGGSHDQYGAGPHQQKPQLEGWQSHGHQHQMEKQQQQQQQQFEPSPLSAGTTLQEMPMPSHHNYYHPQELPGAQVPVEMQGTSWLQRHEAP